MLDALPDAQRRKKEEEEVFTQTEVQPDGRLR